MNKKNIRYSKETLDAKKRADLLQKQSDELAWDISFAKIEKASLPKIDEMEEYLNKLRNSKYGLCLRGYGSKCHREVELMAFGTVPIITSEVSIDSYMDPPQENKHYIRCNTPENLKEILSNISKEKWEIMSNNCYEWYERNVHSKTGFKNFLSNILYK